MSLFQCRLEEKSALSIYPSHQAILTFAATCGILHRLSHHRSLTAGFADCAKGLQTTARWCRVAETVHNISCQTNTYTEDFKRIAGTSNSQSQEVFLSTSWVASQWVCLWFLFLFISSTTKFINRWLKFTLIFVPLVFFHGSTLQHVAATYGCCKLAFNNIPALPHDEDHLHNTQPLDGHTVRSDMFPSGRESDGPVMHTCYWGRKERRKSCIWNNVSYLKCLCTLECFFC